MGAKKQSETRYIVRLVNRSKAPNLRPITVYPKGESPTCATQEEARQRAIGMRDVISKMPTGMLYEGWKVERIESIEVRTEHDAPGTDAVFSWTFASRNQVSAAA